MGTLIVGILLGIIIILAVSTYLKKAKKDGCGGSCRNCSRNCGNMNKKN